MLAPADDPNVSSTELPQTPASGSSVGEPAGSPSRDRCRRRRSARDRRRRRSSGRSPRHPGCTSSRRSASARRAREDGEWIARRRRCRSPRTRRGRRSCCRGRRSSADRGTEQNRTKERPGLHLRLVVDELPRLEVVEAALAGDREVVEAPPGDAREPRPRRGRSDRGVRRAGGRATSTSSCWCSTRRPRRRRRPRRLPGCRCTSCPRRRGAAPGTRTSRSSRRRRSDR